MELKNQTKWIRINAVMHVSIGKYGDDEYEDEKRNERRAREIMCRIQVQMAYQACELMCTYPYNLIFPLLLNCRSNAEMVGDSEVWVPRFRAPLFFHLPLFSLEKKL
jgi:hypothetical protein